VGDAVSERPLVAGRYEPLERVGAGAMGSVYRARDVTTGDTVAMKVLESAGTEHVHRFGREVRALRGLDHPAIVAYVDHGQTDDGVPFLVMEWVQGETLEDRLARGVLPIADVASIAQQLAEALSVIHARGIVHRDLKPTNIMLAEGDGPPRVRLLDFGVAHLAIQSLGFTRTGTVVGTPEFMSPEQARGEPGIRPAADVFALGAVLYECLTGVSPFAAHQVVATLAKVLFTDPAPVRDLRPDCPAPLAALVRRALNKAVAERPADGAALAAELAALTTGDTPAPPPATEDTVRPALGSAEHAVSTLVLATMPIQAPEASTAADKRAMPTIDDGARLLGQLERDAASLGVRLAPLAHGGVGGAVPHGTAPVDRVRAACRCALAIRGHAPELAIVVTTGRARVAEGLPVGRAIDRASALLDRGVAPGTVQIDEATAGLLDARFEVGGSEAGLTLVDERPRGDSIRRFMGRETPLVGRRRELRMLEMTHAQCADESMARAVLVTAPAGLGKSRLRYELLRRLGEAETPPTVMTGRGDPIRTDSPLSCLASLLRREAGIFEGEEPALMQARLRARVGRSLDEATLEEHLPFLGELAAVSFDDAWAPALAAARRDQRLMADRLRQAFEVWMVAECDYNAVVLVLDDLHWVDSVSVDFVGSLLGVARDRRLFVLALGRPEVDARFGELWPRRPVDRVSLRELSAKASRKLIGAVLTDPDEALVDRIVDLAGGNAFFLEELIRAVAEGDEDGLPSTIASMVQARLNALDPEVRRALRAASVFGEVAWRAGVAALNGAADEARVDALLGALVEAEVLTPRATSRFPGEVEYVFRHALVAETAYAMMGDEDRTLGHRLAGDWLERAGEHDAASLAEHFERGGWPERAAAHFARAALGALAAQDLDVAARRVERGLRLSQHVGASETGATLHAVGAEVERWRGHAAAARAHAEMALAQLPPGDAAWVRAATEAIAAAARLGDYDRAEHLALAVEGLDEDDGALVSHRVSALCLAARQLFHAGRYASADARIAAVHRLAAAGGVAPIAEAELHRVEAARARQFGDPWGDMQGYAAAVDAYDRAGDARRATNTRVSLGFALAELGDVTAAEAQLRRALAQAEQLGLHPIVARAHHNLGMVLCEQGRHAEAQDVEQRAIDAAVAAGDRRLEGGSRVYLSQIHLDAGDPEAAAGQARLAIEAFADMPPARAGALAALARALVAGGHAEQAREPAAEGYRLLETLGGIEEYEALIQLAAAQTKIANGEDPGPVLEASAARLRERAGFIPEPRDRERFIHGDSINAALDLLCRAHEGGA